ncbi:MAG: fumarylacetoacetate hydrolase family protein [Planctomycetaceae bacterium]
MRLCRFEYRGERSLGFYRDDHVLPLTAFASQLGDRAVTSESLLPLLPGGELRAAVRTLQSEIEQATPAQVSQWAVPVGDVRLLTPIAPPGKLMLLAGNYSRHIEEQGGAARERDETFPYLFMKPLTTLVGPGDPIRIPAHSPHEIDWEIELGVIIGKTTKNVSEADALDHVAGYTVVNDISGSGVSSQPAAGRTAEGRLLRLATRKVA